MSDTTVISIGTTYRNNHVLSHVRGISETLDQCRIKVAESRGANNHHVTSDENPGSPVADRLFQSLQRCQVWLALDTIAHIVSFQAGCGQFTLDLRDWPDESLRIPWEVWQQKGGDQRPARCCCSLNDLHGGQHISQSRFMLRRTKSHLHPSNPCAPSSPPVMAPAMMPPNAPDRTAAEIYTANRFDCSFFRYHEDRMRSMPGAKPASSMPTTSLRATSW